MEDVYKVYPDKVRVYTTGLIFAVFAGAFFAVLFAKTWLILKLFALLFAILFAYLVYHTLAKAFQRHPEYIIDQHGVTDNTREEVVTLPWEDIMKIEMVPNNAVMQIGILAKDALKQDRQGANLKENMKNNGNVAFYTIMIDGFDYRQKQFTGIFKELERQGGQYNPQILISEYIDPETKRKMADKREDARRALRLERKMADRQLAGKPTSRWKFW